MRFITLQFVGKKTDVNSTGLKTEEEVCYVFFFYVGSRGEFTSVHLNCWQTWFLAVLGPRSQFSSCKLMVIPRFQRRYHSLILGVFLPFLKLVVAQSFLYCIFSLSHTSLSSSILEGSLFLKTHIIRLGPFRHSTKLSI